MDSNDIFNRLMDYSSNPTNSQVPPTNKVKKSEKLLMSIAEQGFNMSELGSVIRSKGNQLIISIAGSGKTTALIFKIMYDITTGEATRIAKVNGNEIRVLDKVWVCTFLKSGADELKAKLAVWQRRLKMLDTSESMAFSTLHAEFKRVLTELGVVTNIIDSGVNSKNLKTVTEKYAIKYEGKPLNSDMLRNLESALTYTRNRLDEKRYDRDVYDELEIGPTIVDAILREWKLMRKDLGVMDFEDLQELLYDECVVKNNLEVINFLAKRYNYIYVDEFQDTSQIQYELLKIYASGVKKIVVIGDDDQTIYSWRGSYNKIITTKFAEDFKPTISSLSVNYRCPGNVLMAIKPSIEKNVGRFKKEIKSYKDGGTLRVGEYSSYKVMVENLADMIYEDVKNDMSVAVLCRVNSDGLLPALMLDKLGKFQYSISGDGMTLDSYIGRQVINIARLFTDKATSAVRGVLSQLTWNSYSVNNIMKVCKNNKVSFWEIPDSDLAYSCPDIADKLKMWKSWRKGMGDIQALKYIYRDFRTNVYSRETQYNIVCRSVISSVEAMLDYTRATSIEEFIEELEEVNERLKARKRKYTGSKVRIATVHEFKGKEADSVYIWNDSEDVFPTSHTDDGNLEEFEEERRIHYIACTRARKISTVMYMRGKKGVFLKEMDLSNAIVLESKVGGELRKRENENKVDRMLEDEDYFDESPEGKGIDFSKVLERKRKEKAENAVRSNFKKIIISTYDEHAEEFGWGYNQIWRELVNSGYTTCPLDFVREVVEEYESELRNRKVFNSVEVDPEDRRYILQEYRKGVRAEEILEDMESGGYDNYTLGDIREVIDEYIKRR